VLLARATFARRRLGLFTARRLFGLALSMQFAVPMARLFTRELQFALADLERARCASEPSGFITDRCRADILELCDRLASGEFNGARWVRPEHAHLRISAPLRGASGDGGAAAASEVLAVSHSDASGYAWGAVLDVPRSGAGDGFVVESGAVFEDTALGQHINVKEADAVLRSLLAVLARPEAGRLRGGFVDFHIDNQSIVDALARDGNRNPDVCRLVKAFHLRLYERDLFPRFFYVHTSLNKSDALTRESPALDSRLDRRLFLGLLDRFGDVDADLFASPGSAQRDRAGARLPYFSRYLLPPRRGWLGANALAGDMAALGIRRAYAFPPFGMCGAVLQFARSQRLRLVLVWPDPQRPRPWRPALVAAARESVLLLEKGSSGLSIPSASRGIVPFPAPCRLRASLFCFD